MVKIGDLLDVIAPNDRLKRSELREVIELAGIVPYRASNDVSIMDMDAIALCATWVDSDNRNAAIELLDLTIGETP